MRRWVIVTGKGEGFVTSACSAAQASNRFSKRYPGAEVAQVYEVTEF